MDNFGFDLEDDDEEFEGFGDFESDNDEGFGDSRNSGSANNEKPVRNSEPVEIDSNTKKTAIIVIVAGIVIVLVVLFLMGKLGKIGTEPRVANTPVKQNTEVVKEPSQVVPVANSEWKNVEFTEVNLSEKLPTVFTVTDIKHYVKVDSSERLIMKTTVTGSLNGFDGTYRIDIPYNDLTIGDQFKINVRVGKYNGKTVISY